MAVIKTSNLAYTKEQALIKRIKVEQNFAQQVYVLFREKKFGITPCCYSDYESAVLNKALCDWRYSASNKSVMSTDEVGVFIEPLAIINTKASMACPPNPSNVCTIEDIANLRNSAGTYSQCFDSAIATWVITHNLGKFPSVTIVDVNNEIVIGDIDYTSSNIVTVTFNNPFAGCAFLNSK
mgnify:FL=1|jgi:hypothetical protein|tara:strand:+ start:4487 stop:5029 length:543 start_codon:yes stop_codon:yes gene_type:complete